MYHLTAHASTAAVTMPLRRKGSRNEALQENELRRCMESGCDETREYNVVATKVEAPVKSYSRS
jgi:hypothetical protein